MNLQENGGNCTTMHKLIGVLKVLEDHQENAPPLEDVAPEPAPGGAGTAAAAAPQKPNEMCACGSGKKYKKCCKVMPSFRTRFTLLRH